MTNLRHSACNTADFLAFILRIRSPSGVEQAIVMEEFQVPVDNCSVLTET
jgi:hypothetical protein